MSKTPLSAVSLKHTFPCTECPFEAQSARQLSRHKAVTHTQNALKCVLCPFVTAYQTNLLRHRKDVHGICGSKGNKSCKFCGFVSEDNDTLIHHQIEFHQDILKSAQAKFAKELLSAGGDESIADFEANFETMSGELFHNRAASTFQVNLQKKQMPKGKKTKLKGYQHQPSQHQHQRPGGNNTGRVGGGMSALSMQHGVASAKHNHHPHQHHHHHSQHSHSQSQSSSQHNNGMAMAEGNEFDDFWKAGFMDSYTEPAAVYYGQQQASGASGGTLDSQNDSAHTSRSSTPKSGSVNGAAGGKDHLPATRIRRQYTCNDCGIRTVNPREFLYHRRDGHGHKIKIVECPYCVYACQYVQKLQRHLLLVHKLQAMVTPSGEPINIRSVANGDSGDTGTGESVPYKQRRYKKFKAEDFDGASLLDNDISNSNFEPEITMEENDSFNDEDFEQINNFEMNLNEYDNNGEDDQESAGDAEREDGDDDVDQQFPVNLECSLCKIKFGDIVSAQKHFLKYHQHSDSKSLIMTSRLDSGPMPMTTSQRKVFDSLKNVHSCNYCGYKTRWISELERHVRVHSKEKPFKCDFCDFKSKWKGDLNRHIQRYHPSECTLPADGESDTSGGNGNNSQHTGNDEQPSSQRHMQHSLDGSMNHHHQHHQQQHGQADDYANSYEGSLEVDEGEMMNGENSNGEADGDAGGDTLDLAEESNPSPASGNGSGSTAKMYKCTYCDFMCSTASRFHVHYVQHLNTKPFQCSICGHRSNWEWDVTKHIKMKAQRDPNHAKAHPVLIHDSGKRDYSKYNKFVIWVGQAEAEQANNDANKIDFRAKRYRTEEPETEVTEQSSLANLESLLMPEVCFEEVDGEAECGNVGVNLNSGANSPDKSSKSGTVKSVIVSRHGASRNRLLFCSECPFKHQFARVLVAHLAGHTTGGKPYGCKQCPFESNWREVVINHNRTEHMHSDALDFEMRFRCVIDESCLVRVVALEELAQFELESAASPHNESFDLPTPLLEPNSSLIEPNLYEEKAVIRCELCPFLTTNHKKMGIHCRFHNPAKGALKCNFCPYFVNGTDKLLRHQKLHQKSGGGMGLAHGNFKANLKPVNSSSRQFHGNFGGHHGPKQASSLISCSLCPFRTSSVPVMSEHTKLHEQANAEDFMTEFAEGMLDQSMEEEKEYLGKSAVSLINVNNMKNGTAKKFSYVCPDCPAAFKSPGDYKIHAVFHSSDYQHPCPYCTYKARNKPQLCKHLYVHTAEYIAKRANSYPDGTKHLVGTQEHGPAHEITMPTKKPLMGGKAQPKINPKTGRKHRARIEFPMKPVKVKLNSEAGGKQKIVFNNSELMANQEFLETKEYLQRINSGIKNRCMYRCSTCPAVFTKVNTLIYHMTLHDQTFAYTCELCSYSNTSEDNLGIHQLLHNLTESQAALGYNFNYNCHKCPAGFSKRTRLEKHLSLHGAKFNWKCDKCDYSVRYAATLVKHRALHLINPNFKVHDNDLTAVPPAAGAAAAAGTVGTENGSAGSGALLASALANGANTTSLGVSDLAIPASLKFKLNLGKHLPTSASNGDGAAAAVATEEEDDEEEDEIAILADPSALLVDEEILDEEDEEVDPAAVDLLAVPDDEEELLDDDDSFDGIPHAEAMMEIDEDEDEEEEEEVEGQLLLEEDEGEASSLNELTIDTP